MQIFDKFEVFGKGGIIITQGSLDICDEWIYQHNTLYACKVAQYLSYIWEQFDTIALWGRCKIRSKVVNFD